jgi:hypothetical protein
MVISTKELVQQKLSDSAENELITYCNKAFNIARTGRFSFERQWYLNMAFYFGRQYAQWVTSALDNTPYITEASYSKLYEPAVPPWRVRLICNKIRPIIRGELAKVTKEKPRGFILPASTDDDDLAGARAGESIHEFLWNDIKMNKMVRRSVFWMLLCGTAYIKDWYEPNTPDSGGIKGKICAEPVTAFHLCIPDLQEEELENQPYVIHSMAKDADWVKQNYGKDVKPDSSATSGILEQKFMVALGVQSQTSTKRYVSVREAWIKPNAKYKDGLFVVWAGNTLLYSNEGWPYAHKEYPFTKFDHIPTGRFYGESSIVDLLPLQKEYNRTRSQIIEAKNRMSKPQLVAARGSIDANKVTSEPGLIIFYQPGFPKPEGLPLQNLPSYVVDEIQRIQVDMNDIASQHEISKGQTPPGVSAATAISFLQEQDDSKLSTTIASLEEGVERLGRHFLSHVHQFWSAERTIRVTGLNGQFEAYQFSKSSLNGNIDFKIEAGSAAPVSRAAKQAFIMELMKAGYIPPDRGLKYLDMAEVGKLYQEMQLANRQAQRENLKLCAGEQFGANNYDKHDVHIPEHDNYRMTEAFESQSDEVKTSFEDHVNSHKQLKAQAMGVQLPPGDPRLNNPEAAMQQQPGMPPANGAGPPVDGTTQGEPGAPPGGEGAV